MDKVDNLLLCVGAQKSGTTWLYEALKNEPSIEFGFFKELHYFDYKAGVSKQLPNILIKRLASAFLVSEEKFKKTFFDDIEDPVSYLGGLLNDDWYLSQFSNRRFYCADFTPEYALLDELGYDLIKGVSRNQKIIFIMRDPVSRSLSALQYFYQNRGRELSSVSEYEILKKIRSQLVLDRSKYEVTIKNLQRSFKKENVLYLFYEEVMSDKRKAVETVSDFLDISFSTVSSKDLDRKVNYSNKYAFSKDVQDDLRESLSDTYSFVKDFFGYVPYEWLLNEN